jgi:putative transposase
MARPHRAFQPGITAHVIQRGNDRTAIFRQYADYHLFLYFLETSAARHAIAVHAYVLMSNHFHLMATPGAPETLPGMMQELGGRYVRYFNRIYNRTGTLWEGRYRALTIQNERRWLMCLRYVEQNPVRAGIVRSPDGYAWSSYKAHAYATAPAWLASHPVYDALGRTPTERGAAYRSLAGIPLTEEELLVTRQSGVGHVSDLPG